MDNIKRAAVYARVSKADGQETENQLAQLREFAERQGWQIIQYTDRMTGSRADRPEFQRMMADASQRKFDVLLFWALDRLTREGAFATLSYLERLKSYGIGFRSYTEAFLDTTTLGPFADGLIALLGALAKQERVRLSERTKAGLARAKKAGRIGGRPALANKVREQAIQLRQSGLSLPKIAEKLKVSVGFVHAATKA